MNRETVAAYCRIAAETLPLACAKRLRFDHADDCRAVLEDIGGADSRHSVRPLFELAAELLALHSRPMPQHAGRSEEEAFRMREWARLYPLIVPLVPVPADTPWVSADSERSRTFAGYKLTLRYHRATRGGYLYRSSPARWESVAWAAGGLRTVLPNHEKGSSVKEMRRELEAWATAHPIAEARLAAWEASRADR